MTHARRATRAASLLVALAGAMSAVSPVRLTGAEPSAPVRRLQRDIDAILAAPGLQTGTWGIAVSSLARNETFYGLNAKKLLLPSSNMKILALAAAAQRLGWNYTFETRLEA